MDNNTPNSDVIIENDIDKEQHEEEIQTSPKRERQKLSYYFTNGIIMSWLGMLTEAIYRALAGGFFGRIFTAYSSEENALERGFLKASIVKNRKLRVHTRRIRRVLAEGFENSFLPGVVEKIIKVLLEASLKNYGNLLLSAGLYTVFTFFVRRFVGFFEPVTLTHLVTGVVFVAVSMPLLMSKISLSRALGASITARTLFCDVFGISEETFDIPVKQSKFRANFSIILGMALGLLTLVISPVYLSLIAFLIIAVSIIMSTPEIGVLVSLFLLPFLSLFDAPSMILGCLVGFSGLGYFVKLVRGKRLIRFEIVDVAVIFFLVVVFFSGVFSVGGVASLGEAVFACAMISVYFLIVNMIRTKMWVNRCVMALVSSAGITAVLGVMEYFFGSLSTQWLDTTYFSDIRGRVVSLFDNSNVLAFYLVIICPFALNLIFKGHNKSEKFLAGFCFSAIVLCTVFTWSRGAWLGLIVSVVVYLLVKTRSFFKAFFGFLLALPILSIVIPSNVIKRFMSIGDLSDSSTYYRVLTWRGSLDAIGDSLGGGYGYGLSVFERVYPVYATAGIEAAEHSHSLFLQIMFGMGLVGLVVFLVVILLFAQKNFEFFSKKEVDVDMGIPVAAFSAIVAALVMGMFDYIWYNSRVMFLFWAVMAISCAAIRISDESTKRRRVEVSCDSSSAYIDI